MFLRGQSCLAHSLDQFNEPRIARQIGSQYQRINEEADQVLELAPTAIRMRRADYYVFLTAISRKQRVPRRKQDHKRRNAFLLAETPHLRRKRAGKYNFMHGAEVCAGRGPRAIGRQFQACRRPLQPLFPEFAFGGQPLAGHSLALPYGKIGVLNRQLWQRRRQSHRVRAVEGGHLLNQDPGSPTVGHDVMEIEEQHMLVRTQPEQLDSQQRTGREVERT